MGKRAQDGIVKSQKKLIDKMFPKEKRYKDGEPCPHPGCRNHFSHPCEVCGRVGAKESH